MSQCHYCDDPSTKLCDSRLASGGTCGRPMCEYHAHRKILIHVYAIVDGSRLSYLDTLDYCDEHSPVVEAPTP